MKKFLLLGTLLLISCQAPSTSELTGFELDPAAEFTLEIRLIEEESSEDANGTETKFLVSDNKLNYSWSYWGYHPDNDFERSKVQDVSLTDSELEELKALIESEGLWKSVNEEKDSSDLGDSLTIEFVAEDSEHSVTSFVSGMDWMLSTKEGNIENTDFVESVGTVVSFLKNRL